MNKWDNEWNNKDKIRENNEYYERQNKIIT